VNYPGRRRVQRRRSLRRRRVRIIHRSAIAAVTFAVLFTIGWAGVNRSNFSSEIPQASQRSFSASPSLATLAGPSHRAIVVKRSKRPVYNYSVVRGGVRSVQELREATLRDEQVAQHYAGFRYEKARVVHLEKPVLVYLSYRKNGHILWTKKKHALKAGETVITDGKITARTRCANRITVRKQLAVSPEPDPSPVELDRIEAPQEVPPAQLTYPAQYQTALLAPPTGPGGTPSGPPIFGTGPFVPIGGGGGGGGGVCETPAQEKQEEDSGFKDDESKEKHCPPKPPPHKPPAAVPEPQTLLLMATGLAVIGLGLWHRKAAFR
jgi:hypothetical protein